MQNAEYETSKGNSKLNWFVYPNANNYVKTATNNARGRLSSSKKKGAALSQINNSSSFKFNYLQYLSALRASCNACSNHDTSRDGELHQGKVTERKQVAML